MKELLKTLFLPPRCPYCNEVLSLNVKSVK